MFAVPMYIVNGLKTYFLAARPGFLPVNHKKPTRCFAAAEGKEAYSINTEYFFYNTSKLREFRVRQIASQMREKLEKMQKNNDVLTRKLKRIFPSNNDTESRIESDPIMTMHAIAALGPTTAFSQTELQSAVDKRCDQLLYIRSAARAAMYIERYPKERVTTDNEKELMDKYYKKMCWSGDFSKFAKNVSGLRTDRSAKRAATFIDPVLKFKNLKDPNTCQGIQIEINERITNQTWPGVEDAVFPGAFGRGVISTTAFLAGDIIMDYHGTVVHNETYDSYIRKITPEGTEAPSEFVLEIPHRRAVIDATSEICPDHPTMRCLGRLSNHGAKRAKRKNFCNMKLADIELDNLPKNPDGKFRRVILFVARRNIAALEQLRWDYDDKNAQQLFTE